MVTEKNPRKHRAKKPPKPYKIKWHRVQDAMRTTNLYWMSGVGFVYHMKFPNMPGNNGWFCRRWLFLDGASEGPFSYLIDAKKYLEGLPRE